MPDASPPPAPAARSQRSGDRVCAGKRQADAKARVRAGARPVLAPHRPVGCRLRSAVKRGSLRQKPDDQIVISERFQVHRAQTLKALQHVGQRRPDSGRHPTPLVAQVRGQGGCLDLASEPFDQGPKQDLLPDRRGAWNSVRRGSDPCGVQGPAHGCRIDTLRARAAVSICPCGPHIRCLLACAQPTASWPVRSDLPDQCGCNTSAMGSERGAAISLPWRLPAVSRGTRGCPSGQSGRKRSGVRCSRATSSTRSPSRLRISLDCMPACQCNATLTFLPGLSSTSSPRLT